MYSTNFRFTQAFVSQNVDSGGSVRFGWRTICPVSPAPFGRGLADGGPSGCAHDGVFESFPGVDLDEILCLEEERQVGNDNCVSYRTLKLQIRESPMRPHSSRRASRSTSIPTAPTPSSTDHDTSAATTRKERSEMRKTPLKSARRRNPVDGMDKPQACPPPAQGEQSQKQRANHAPPNRTTSFAIGNKFRPRDPHAHWDDSVREGQTSKPCKCGRVQLASEIFVDAALEHVFIQRGQGEQRHG
jgi:hypothetical protein